MFQRILNPLKSSSFFLFGARNTGKTTLIKKLLAPMPTLSFDLLDPETEDRLIKSPAILKEKILPLAKKIEWVFIDEIQKAPKLINVVHDLIENTKVKFALTGSSARKLKRGGINLLAGRAFVNMLFPLTHIEIGRKFDLNPALEYGTLPKIYSYGSLKEKQEFLRAYTFTYLQEEIKAEQITRKLDPFRNFLEIAAQGNGDIINFTKIANDIGVDVKTVQSYYNILEDTLVGYLLEPFHLSIRKRQRTNPKFYFFDTGVKRALERTLTVELKPQTYAFGKAFEHFIICEILRLANYYSRDYRFSYLRTKDNAEIDLIIERPGMPLALVEIKSTDKVNKQHVGTLNSFEKDFPRCELFCISRDKINRKIENTNCLYWTQGLQELGLIG